MSQQSLFAPLIAVHCFFGERCGHVVRDADPQQAHDLMEEHYEGKHQAAIDRLVGLLR